MATTPNYSLSIYNSSDTDVRFLDFRVAIAGTQTTSNFYVIDGALKEHSDAINTLKNSPQAYIVKANFASGIYNAIVSGFTGYKANQLIILSLNQTNTGPVSININNSSNKNVMLYSDAGTLRNAIAGEFVENSAVLCYYDGTQFVAVGVPKGSAIYVDGEQRDILQISSSGAIESSGKQAGQPNGIATLDSDGKVEQVAKIADGAASGEAVYSGNAIEIPYVSENRIASITAYGENAQGGTTEAPVALTGVEDVFVVGKNLLPKATKTQTIYGVTFTPNPDGSVSVSGTCAGNIAIYNYADNLVPISPNQVVYLSGASQLVKVVINEKTPSGVFVRNVLVDRGQGISGTLTKQKEENILYATLQVQVGDTPNLTIYPMLNLGKSPLSYEPYSGSITALPIPRPLHKVGDVRDVCQTRVKSVYDKRIVLDGTEDWRKRTDISITGGSCFYPNNFVNDAISNAPVVASAYFVGRVSPTINLWDMRQVGTSVGIQFNAPFAEVSDFTAWLAEHPLTVYYRSTAYDGTNGLDVCMTEYQNDFVELDGTEASHIFEGMFYLDYSAAWPTPANRVNGVCSHYPYGAYGKGKIGLTDNGAAVVYNPNGDYTGDEGGLANWKAYLAAQKAAGTPVQIAYQLATPEVYATDPVDFDNTAGPLTVVTGGQVEVKMTDFVTDRTPAFLNKLDKTGDGSDVTVTFTEAAIDTDIASGDKLSILFGKILKRFSTITSKFTTVDNSITQIESDISDITDGTTVVAQANKVTNALVIMSNSGTALVNYDGSATANMTLSPSNVGAEPAFTKNTAFNKNFGSSAGTVCQGNDGRLSDARRSSNITMSLSGTNLSINYS